MEGETAENPWLSLIETICIAWFTLEYFLRQHPLPSQLLLRLKDWKEAFIKQALLVL